MLSSSMYTYYVSDYNLKRVYKHKQAAVDNFEEREYHRISKETN